MADEYTIEQGDTLSSIADLYDTTVPELMANNKIENPDRIYPGRKIMLPAPPVPERNPSFSYQQDVRNARLRASPLTPESSTEMEGRLQPVSDGPQALPPMVAKPGAMAEEEDEEFHRFSFLPLGGVPGSGELELAWPKPLYDAFTGFQKISSGEIEPYVINPETGKQEINPEMIKIATAIAGISMTGGLAGTGGQAVKQAMTPDQDNALIKIAAQVAKKRKATNKLPESSRIRFEPGDEDLLAFLPQTAEPKTTTLTSGVTKKGGSRSESHSGTMKLSDGQTEGWFSETFNIGGKPLYVDYMMKLDKDGGLILETGFTRATPLKPSHTGGDFGRPSESLTAGASSLATVVNAVSNAIKATQPKALKFYAANANLIPLYDRFARGLAEEFGATTTKTGRMYYVSFPKSKNWLDKGGGEGGTALGSGIIIKFPGGKKPTQQQAAVDEVARFNELFEKTTNRTPKEQEEFAALAQKFRSDNDALPQAKDMPKETVDREFATDLEKYGDALIRQRAGEKGFQFKAPKEGQILDFANTRQAVHDFAKANKMTVDEVLAIFRKPNET